MSNNNSKTVQLDKERPGQLLRYAIRFRVNQVSDSPDMHQAVQARAMSLVQASKLDMAQIRKLENIAYSAEKVSDITDYLKQQIGRSNRDEKWRYNNVGEEILTDWLAVEADERSIQIQKQVKQIAAELLADYGEVIDKMELERQLRLLLYREYIRHMTAHYLYKKVQEEE